MKIVLLVCKFISVYTKLDRNATVWLTKRQTEGSQFEF